MLFAVPACAALVGLAVQLEVGGGDPDPEDSEPQPYPSKAWRPRAGPSYCSDLVTVKFANGLRLRAVDGSLRDVANDVEQKAAGADIAALHALPIASWRPVHGPATDSIDALRRQGETNSGRKLPDLNLQFFAFLEPGADAEAVLSQLNALACVEMALPIALPAPLPFPPEMASLQSELRPAPVGLGAGAVHAWPGVSVALANVRIADVEYAWNRLHEDLPPNIGMIGFAGPELFLDKNHGTAVLGTLTALPNDWGTTGTANGANVSVVAAFEFPIVLNIAGAISRAAVDLSPGDVILIEQQVSGPMSDPENPDSQFGLVPVEWDRPTYDAIVVATAAGRVVVEPAGNGRQDLDAQVYSTGNGGHHPFRPENDSGAILVGAGWPLESTGIDRSRMAYSNYGSAVDVQAAGYGVVTLGYGDLFDSEGVNRAYTGGFGGTSGASAIIAGAAALLEAVHQRALGAPCTPSQMRSALIATGSPQQESAATASQHIGPRPDLRAAAFALLNDDDCNATGVPDALEEITQPVVMAAAGAVLCYAGNTALLEITAEGTPPLAYRWQRDAHPLSDGPTDSGSVVHGAELPTLIISSTGRSDAGSYVCVVRDHCGKESAATVTLSVSPRCVVDFDRSGGLSVEDMFAFLAAWFAGDARADINGNGLITTEDIFAFFEVFFAGCG